MAFTTCDHNLDFLEMVLWVSEIDHLNNGKPIISATHPRPVPINSIDTAAQFTEAVRIYKDKIEKFTTYCEFRIILISMITTNVQKN